MHLGRWLLPYFPDSIIDQVNDLWNAWGPVGHFDVGVLLTENPLRPTNVDVHGITMDIEGSQRIEMRGGTIAIRDAGVQFDNVVVDVGADGSSTASFEASGGLARSDEDAKLTVHSEQVDLGAEFLSEILLVTAGVEGESIWNEIAPAGQVQVDVVWETANKDPFWELGIAPRVIEATWRDRRLMFRDGGGSTLRVGQGGVAIDRFLGTVGTAQIDIGGRFDTDPMRVSIGGTYHGSLGSDVLRSLAGPAWEDVLHAIELDDSNATLVDPLQVALSEGNNGWSGSIEGQVALHGAAMSAGIRIEGIEAAIDALIQLDEGAADAQLDVQRADADVSGARLRGLRGRIATESLPEAPNHLRIGPLVGELGEGHVVIEAEAAGQDGAWTASVDLANARLSRLFPSEEPTDGAMSPTGEVDADLHLRGAAGNAAATSGVGTFRVTQGMLRTLPALVAIQQVLHLSSPVVGAISFVDVDFLIHGSDAVLTDIVLASGPFGQGGFSLNGKGQLDLKTMGVQAQLRPRGSWPIVRDLIGAIQDQFYEISMYGHVGSPEVGIVAFPGITSNR